MTWVLCLIAAPFAAVLLWLLWPWGSIPAIDDEEFQGAVRCLLLGAPMSGRDLQAALARRGIETTLAGFYRRMARLEDQGDVDGWYEPWEIDGLVGKERWYRIVL